MAGAGAERQRGNELFRAGDWGGALARYRAGARAAGAPAGGGGGGGAVGDPGGGALCHSNAAEALLRAAEEGGLEGPAPGEGEGGTEEGDEGGSAGEGGEGGGLAAQPLGATKCLREARIECNRALELEPRSVKSLMRRCRAAEGLAQREKGSPGASAPSPGGARTGAQISALGKQLELVESALRDARAALELDAELKPAKAAVSRLEPWAERLREETKAETLGKLKDLGNAVLGRFGMSLDNFKAVQDPDTGSYSVSFQQ